ncbi:MAG: hypothetical protein Q7U75_08250 [Desulfobacterales bacterium]|nr:hypothetical protein [Desulfobacterales bacterium]
MSPDKPRPRAKRCGIEFEEERAWVGFYKRVGRDPAIAAEVMAQLEADAVMKRTHLALYLCCKESLRVHKARQARNKRIGQFVRRLGHALLVQPMLGLRTRLRHGGDIAIECLPDTRKEPALQQVRRLGQDAEFAAAQASFEQHVSSTVPVATTAGASEVPKPSAAAA